MAHQKEMRWNLGLARMTGSDRICPGNLRNIVSQDTEEVPKTIMNDQGHLNDHLDLIIQDGRIRKQI